MSRSTVRICFLACTLCAAALLAAGFVALAQSAPPALVAEKGKFRILVDGKEAGKEDFTIAGDGAEWVARGAAEISDTQGGTSKVNSTLRLRSDGTPAHYEWAMQGANKASGTMDFVNGTATIELRVEGKKPFTEQLFFNTPRVVILDNNLYHQYAILARLYDWQKKGPQEFPVFIPQTMVPGKVIVEYAGPETIGGAKAEMLRVRTEDLEIDLYLVNLRLVRLAAPASNAEAIRE